MHKIFSLALPSPPSNSNIRAVKTYLAFFSKAKPEQQLQLKGQRTDQRKRSATIWVSGTKENHLQAKLLNCHFIFY